MRTMTITTTTITKTTKTIVIPDLISEEDLQATYEALTRYLTVKGDHDGYLYTLVAPAP